MKSSSAVSSEKKHQRRKSSSVRQLLVGNIELAEESSTEIIVNSTSILSLSSEAAQLTVKNGSVESGHSSGGSSKSSDEMSITYRNLDMLNNTSSSHHHHHHSHQSYSNKIITVTANGISRNRKDEGDSAEASDEHDSDDTSYAKAISSQTIESPEMVVVPVVMELGTSAASLPVLSSYCHSHRAAAAAAVSAHHLCQHTAAMHACCHHHLEHHHHHPHHVQHEVQVTQQTQTPPQMVVHPVHYSHHLNSAPKSMITTTGMMSNETVTCATGNNAQPGSTLPMAVVKSRADQMATEVLQSALVAQHIHLRGIASFI